MMSEASRVDESKRRTPLRTALVAFAALCLLGLFVFGILLMQPAQGCPLAGPPVEDSPPGWTWEWDLYNGCAWTLFDEQGDRAPPEVYDSLSVDPPGPRFLYLENLLGISAIVVSIAVAAVLIHRIRKGSTTSESMSE